MKNFVRIFAFISALVSAVVCFCISSCSEDDETSNPQEKLIKSVNGWVKYGSIVKDSATASLHQSADGTFKLSFASGVLSPEFSNVNVTTKADSMMLHAQNQVYDKSDDKTLTLSLEGFLRPDSDAMFVKVFGAELSDTLYFASDSSLFSPKKTADYNEKHDAADVDLVAKVSGQYVGDCVVDGADAVEKSIDASLTEKGYLTVELKQCKFVDKMPAMDISLPNMSWSKSGDSYEFWGNSASYNLFGAVGEMPVEVTGTWNSDGKLTLSLVMVMNGVNHTVTYAVSKQ